MRARRRGSGIACVLLLTGTTAIVAAQQPAFRTAVEQVRVDVLVSENGRAVTGLRADDFEVTDNGVVQQIDLLAFERLPLNVVLALDMSQSTAGERLLHLRLAARAVLTGLGPDDRAALLTFSDSIQLVSPLTRDRAALRAALENARPVGGTALFDGAYAALMLAGSDAGRDLVLVFSDGVDTDSFLSAERVLDTAGRTDAVVYGVTIGNPARAGFLQDLSDRTGGQLVPIASTADLEPTFGGIVDEFRQRYVLSFAPREVAKSGWHRLQVRVKGRRPTITARQGYVAGS